VNIEVIVMANHKRRRPKNRRGGCLLCKPHKANGCKGSLTHQTNQEKKARVSEKEQRREAADPTRH